MAKLTEKQRIEEWKRFTEGIRNSTPIDTTEKTSDRLKRIKRLEADREAWIKYYFDKYAFAAPNKFHIASSDRIFAAYDRMEQKGSGKFYQSRCWARGLSKSTRRMMEIFYLVFARKFRGNILLISKSEKNALKLIKPYRGHLEANNRIIQDYGKQESLGSWESGEFTTLTGVSFLAVGREQSPRGAKNEELRTNVLIFDDVDDDELCRNPKRVKEAWNWIEQAVIPTVEISRPYFIFFDNNLIAKDSLTARAYEKASDKETINIRDENGKSTWWEKNTEEMIDEMMENLSYASQQKEYYNNPITEGAVFKTMAYKPVRPLSEYSLLVCYTDPSYKDSEKNDYKATILVGKWRDEFHVIKAFCKQTTVAEMVDWHYQVMAIVGVFGCYYFMEQVFMQDFFYAEFNKASIIRGKAVPISGDTRAKPQKFVRIESMLEPLNRNGKFYLNEDEKANQHMKNLYDQFLAFEPGSTTHDDGPDACEGAVWVINNKEAINATGQIKTFKRQRNSRKSF